MKVSGSIQKWKKPAGAAVMAITAIGQIPNVALAKFSAGGVVNYGSLPQGYILILSRIFGPNIASSIATQLKLAPTTLPQGVSLLGPINTTTGAGVGLIIADYVIKHFKIPYYSQYISWLIKALGAGSLIAGVVGGFLDPDPSSTPNPLLATAPMTPAGMPNYPQNIVQPLTASAPSVSGGLQF